VAGALIRGRLEGSDTRQPLRRILWIDDEFDPDDALVRLLALEGFRVDIAGSGAEGLLKARAGSYAGIVLDLRLPDTFGLSVLERLVAHDHARPVLVVTGYYHEPEMEAAAIRAGAAAFRHKPLIDIEDLSRVLESMAGRSAPSDATAHDAAPIAGTLIAEPDIFTARHPSQRERIAVLVRRLADRNISSLEFMTIPQTLRGMLRGRRASHRARGQVSALPHDVESVIQHLALKAQSGRVLRETDLERELGIHSREGRLLRAQTGAGYREWRRALRLRHACAALAFSDEHVRQIAFRNGYEHPSQFDRDFHQAFGLTPTAYRRLLRVSPFETLRKC
jgi:DNA-binding response OmpR family regulator